jgi:hypothetical protein
VVAVLPGTAPEDATHHATAVVATGAGHAPTREVAASGQAAIAIGEGWGTLSEIALARKLGRTVVVLVGPSLPGLERAATAAEAVQLALAAAGAG